MCKEIAPKIGSATYRGKRYTPEYPKTVKDSFPVLPGWREGKSYKNGEAFKEARLNLETGEVVSVPITKIDDKGQEWILVHTCKRTLMQERGEGYHFYAWWVVRDGFFDRSEEKVKGQ
jgi:hypothetical protein